MSLAGAENRELRRNNSESILDSRLDSREDRELRLSTFFERYCSHPSHHSCIISHPSDPSLIFVLAISIIPVIPVIPVIPSHPSHPCHPPHPSYHSHPSHTSHPSHLKSSQPLTKLPSLFW